MNRPIPAVAHDTADDLAVLCQALDAGLMHHIAEATAGPPAGGAGHARGVSDPTAVAALRGDPALAAGRELARLVGQMRSAARRARVIAEQWTPPPAAPHRGLTVAGPGPGPGCQSCARLPGRSGTGRWEPTKTGLARPTTVAGRLPEPLWLCGWCYDRTWTVGRLPTVAELDAHHQGRRVPVHAERVAR